MLLSYLSFLTSHVLDCHLSQLMKHENNSNSKHEKKEENNTDNTASTITEVWVYMLETGLVKVGMSWCMHVVPLMCDRSPFSCPHKAKADCGFCLIIPSRFSACFSSWDNWMGFTKHDPTALPLQLCGHKIVTFLDLEWQWDRLPLKHWVKAWHTYFYFIDTRVSQIVKQWL